MDTEPLLAKSGVRAITLHQHTIDVMDAAEAMFGTATAPTPLGACWLRFFRIPELPWKTFHGNLLVACGLHDWGKANDGFQKAIRRRGQQAIRHEHFSALLVAQQPCWDWLGGNADWDRESILSAVLTHHLKATHNAGHVYGFAVPRNNSMGFQSLHTSGDFTLLTEVLSKRLGTRAVIDLSGAPHRWVFDGGNVEMERKRISRLLHEFSRTLKADESRSRRRLLCALRAGLIAADSAASGLRAECLSVAEWVNGTFAPHRQWTGEDVKRHVIDPRIRQVARGGTFGWNEFQNDCADPTKVPARALLLAPCGSGKTLAAWRWIERHAGTGVGHVVFLYPTRATATEGFRDYVSWAPEADATLMHGTSAFDLKGMFHNPDDDDQRKGNNYALSESEQALRAMGYWGRRAFSATVDQFLAFLQYGRGPMCMLPVLANSVIVIDEVHSFDLNMFAALKAFLTEFDVPVLCMTATLPSNRRDELVRECGLTLYDGRPGQLATIASAQRYRLLRVESREAVEHAVREALAKKKRILWVVNQVKRAHSVVAALVATLPADQQQPLVSEDGVKVLCYHSRFKLVDRVKRHEAIMFALKHTPGPAIGVTTQVCEMSLDIDVDLLVTEACPVTSLIQRMGRCNRAQSPRPLGVAGDVLVYAPKDNAPYSTNDLSGLEEFLLAVDGRALSQNDIEAEMLKVDSPASLGDPLCSFLASGPYAVSGENDFRDNDDFTQACVLGADVSAYLRAGVDRPGFVLPVPTRLADARRDGDATHAQLPPQLGVARDGHYHAAVGFCDAPFADWGAN
jgi:CRISPR-associated endonuclease/helicase Cas3